MFSLCASILLLVFFCSTLFASGSLSQPRLYSSRIVKRSRELKQGSHISLQDVTNCSPLKKKKNYKGFKKKKQGLSKSLDNEMSKVSSSSPLTHDELTQHWEGLSPSQFYEKREKLFPILKKKISSRAFTSFVTLYFTKWVNRMNIQNDRKLLWLSRAIFASYLSINMWQLQLARSRLMLVYSCIMHILFYRSRFRSNIARIGKRSSIQESGSNATVKAMEITKLQRKLMIEVSRWLRKMTSSEFFPGLNIWRS